jgi:hypothetical protein
MSKILRVSTALVLLWAAMATADQKGKGKGHDKHGASGESHDSFTHVAVSIFVGDDREVIREYIEHYPGGGLPPGLAKRGGDLPPGLQRQLRKKGTLPPGLRKKLVAFPPELEERLHPLEPGFRRAFIEGRAVIYNEKTSVVLDVFIPF